MANCVPAIVRLWESAWEEFIPFLDYIYRVDIRTVICSTNAIESLNARYRRAGGPGRHFPTERAALKCLYLITRSLDPRRHARRVGRSGVPVDLAATSCLAAPSSTTAPKSAGLLDSREAKPPYTSPQAGHRCSGVTVAGARAAFAREGMAGFLKRRRAGVPV